VIAPQEFDSRGLQAHMAAIICRCGWMLVETPMFIYYCENPLCGNRLKMFRVELTVRPMCEAGCLN